MTDSDFNNVKRKYQDLSLDLNLDQATADESWSNYENIRLRYTLEGEQLPWLVCALYAACRRRSVPTVGGRPGNVIQGNCVSLTRMLQHSNLPLTEFIKKMKHWLAMSNNDEAFCNRIELLERNFAVANNIFKKYKPIFLDLFKNPSDDLPRPPRSRKQRRPPCNATELFHFCWTIYILIKGKYPSIPQDLVSCYSLLLAAIDLIYANVVLANRKDLLNPNCKGLPEGLLSEESTIEDLSSVPVSIMDYLCNKFEGVLVETKVVREYYWNKHIRELIDSKVLKGGPEGTGLIDQTNFDHNVKEVKNAYEEYLLSCGEFDERMFLNEDQVVRSIGVSAITSPTTPSAQHTTTATAASPVDVGSLKNARRNLVQSFEGDHHLVPQTPITGKSYTIDRPSVVGTPLTVVTSGLQKLYTLLAGRKNSPTPELIELFKSCSQNPEENINTQISGLSESFCRLYTRSTEDYTGPSMEFAQLRTQMAQMLYYTFLEHILLDERKRGVKGGVQCEAILKEELFHRTLFTCCIEIVLRSYNDPRRFPWSLQVGQVEPYYFIRIIEPVIRSEKQSDNQLSRELVKHLKGIEEQILDSLAWRHDSPLWQLLTSKGCQVPSCADVNFSDQLETSGATIAAATPLSLGLASSCMSPALKPLVNDKNPSSPLSTLNESFRSPLGQSSARRTLFPTSGGGGGIPSALAFSRPSTLGNRVMTPNTAASTASATSTSTTAQAGAAALLTRSPAANKITLQVKENGVTTLYTLPSTATPLSAATTITTTTVATPTTVAASTAQTTPASEAKSDISSEATPNTEKKKEKPKRAGSLALFFRKFYTLANMRLRDLCDRLDITDTELRRKVWTCFEHSIIHYNAIMKDRHMDQMVMCAIYITCKVTGKDRIFQEIMKHYRNQPQAASHVYRSVLITRSTTTQPQTEGISNATTPAGNKMLSSLPPPTPSQMTGTSSSFEAEERGDLIKFYNHVYVQKIKTFALKFRGTHEGDQPPLSPLPVVRHTPVSPRRKISNNHSVFINSLSPMQGNTPLSPRRPLPYYFNRSPAKDLRVINTMLKMQQDGCGGTRKRILIADETTDLTQPSGIELKRPLMHSNINRRLMQGVLGDRSEAQLSGLTKSNITSGPGNGGGPPVAAITGVRMETENTVDTDSTQHKSGTLPLATLHHNGHTTLQPQ